MAAIHHVEVRAASFAVTDPDGTGLPKGADGGGAVYLERAVVDRVGERP